MDRRDFIKTTGTLIAAAAVSQNMSAAQAAVGPNDTGRVVLPINRRWRYSPKATDAAREWDFDDNTFARVTVPHTNIRLPWHSFDDRSYEFISIYRRAFPPPPSYDANKSVRKLVVVRRLVDVEDHDFGSGVGQRIGNGPPDAPATTGDDGAMTSEVEF